MKKKLFFTVFIVIVILLLIIFIPLSCNVVYFEGFEYVNESLSSVSLDSGTFTFFNELKQFGYIEGNYYYFDKFFDSEKVILYLKYEEEDYWKAKEYLFDNFNLWDEPIKEYNEYIFYLNKDFVDYKDKPETNKYHDYWYYGFPDMFQTYCHNDRNFTLMLVGYSAGDKRKERDLAKDEFGKFLESAFGKYYDFNQ